MKKLLAPGISLRSLVWGGGDAARLFAAPPEIETVRLRLRKLRMRDAKDVYEWSSDPEVARYVLWDAHRSLGETRNYLRYVRSLYRQGAPSSWGVELIATGKVIGTIGIMGWSPEHRTMEVGYSMGRAWWGRGYMPEALNGLLNLIFTQTEANRVEGQCDVRNPRSGRVMEKCGMRKEGVLRQRVYNKGEYVDVALYATVRSDRETTAFSEQS